MTVRGAVIVIVAVCRAGAAARWARASADANPLHARISRIADGQRTIEARLSGSERWRPCAVPEAGDSIRIRCSNSHIDPGQVGGALSVAREARDAATKDGRWALAVMDVLESTNDKAAASRAIERLEQLLAVDSSNTNLRNDLAVAYLADADARNDPWSLFLALDEIERAFQIDSTSAWIVFNRALMLTKVNLYDEAGQAWSAYAAMERGRGWRAEGSRRRGAMATERRAPPRESPPDSVDASRDPQGAREYALDSILPSWASAVHTGARASADSACRAIEAIGVALVARSRDATVSSVARACRGDSPRVAEATLQFEAASRLFRRASFDSAEALLARAAVLLRASRAEAVAGWDEILLGFVHIYRGGRFVAADSLFSQVEREAVARGDSALAARARWGSGLSSTRRGETARGILRFSAAADSYHHIGELTNEAVMQSQVADPLFVLGRENEALTRKYHSQILFAARRDARARRTPLVALGLELVDLGLAAAGIAVLREAVVTSVPSSRPSDWPEALIQLANAELAAGRLAAGRQHLVEAHDALPRISDPSMLARQRMAYAQTAAARDAIDAPDSAIAELGEVDAYYRSMNLAYNRSAPLARRGRIRLQQADTAGALRDIAAAVTAIERQTVDRADATAARDRAAARREVFQALIALDIASGDTIGALAAAERSHGSAFDRVPIPDAGQVLVRYAALPDRLVMWVVNGGSVRLASASVSAERLAALTRRASALIRAGDDNPEWRSVSRELFDLVVGPVDAALRGARELVVVPDGVLEGLPFGALLDSSGRYLVQRLSITRAPALRRPSENRLDGVRALVVGNPAFDTGLFPTLDALIGANNEIDVVRVAYPSAKVLAGPAATKDAVVRELQAATAFHFAGHAELVAGAPGQSHLVLAGQRGDNYAASVLTADEIVRLNLRHLSLVVLSSCGTTQARSRRDVSESGLSDAFLQAGARGVISSLWEVDDRGTVALISALYARIRHGASGSAALRGAQMDLLASGSAAKALRVWGAFVFDEGT